MHLPPHDNNAAGDKRGALTPAASVITWMDDVIFPSAMYRDKVCRVGARLFRLLLGVDAYEGLKAIYTPGTEEASVRTMLALVGHSGDERIVRKIAESMVLHSPTMALYEDAIEIFGLLQAFGVPVGLIGEGSPRAVQGIVSSLGADRLFTQITFSDPELGPHAWQDALLLLEVGSGINPAEATIICADRLRCQMMATMGWNVYFLDRQDEHVGDAPPSVIRMTNLYQLPEALGLIAWESQGYSSSPNG